MEDELLETPEQFTRPDPPKAPVGEAVDPDDPSVNIDRHIAAMDAGTILTGLGFDERKPSWNCADPEYKWWERFVGSQKWTVIRKSDDEPQMFEISVYAPRKLTTPHGSLTDYEQVAGETLHVGKLEAKLRMALGEGLDDPDPKEYLDQITGWIDQLTALGFTPEKFQPGTYNKTVENERLAFHAYLTTKKLSATVEREVYGGSAMGRMFAHSPYRLLFGFRDQAAFLQFVQELNAKLEELAKTKPSHRAGFMLMLALDKMYAQHQGRKAQRVGEALGVPDPDAPEANIERFAQHIEKKEQEWIDSAILNATTEFDQVISRRGITDFRLADELAASLGDKWANTAGYPNGSDEYDIVVSAVNNHASEQFPEGFDPASLGVDLPEAVEDIDPKAYLQQLPIPVRAKIVADRDRVMAEFDANAWFEQASIGELVELAKCEFQSDYPADAVGEFFFDTSLKEWHTAYTGDGFEVYVDESDAQRWVEHNRREWYPMLWPNDMPIKEAADPDDPSAFIQHMETDWREILRKYGWTGDDHYTFTLKFPDRVWGPNWPVNIFAHHGWSEGPEFDYVHQDPDNPDIDAEDAAYERWLVDHPVGRREIEFPDYIAFQFGRESYRRIEVPLAKLASFCSRLVAGAKKVVGTETVASVHQGHGLTDMLWTLGTEIARDLQIPLKESVDDIPKEQLTHMARSGNCPELCPCGAYCTLIQHRLLPDGTPAYHICQTCDSKTADVAENLNVDDPTKELLHAAFDVPAMLQRRGYEKSGSEQAWYKVFRRGPTDLDLMIEVKRRGMGGEASEGDIVYDITLYDYPVHENPEKHWRPFVYRYARNNAQIERVLKILEARIRANNLRGVRNDESLPVAPVPPEDDPEQVIKSHE
ncbi:MAG: hypothetical protein NTU53_00415, partial [Planctomycetota bacterium]|nr:hypothetical protein [Planctomycetota bacterium]